MSPLLWIILISIAALTVGLTVFSYLRARSREVAPPARAHIASQAAPVAVADEVRAIGEQIERAMAEQRVQGETQRQLLAQKLDSVRQSVDGQRTQVDGLRSELRHEVQRRDAELEEIRQQIGSIARGGALPPAAAMPALPPAPEPPRETATAPMIEEMTFAPSAPAEAAPVTAAMLDAPPPAPPPAEPEPSFSEETFAVTSIEEPPPAAPAVAESRFEAPPVGPRPEPMPAASVPGFEETTFAEASFEEAGVEPEPAPSEIAPAAADPFADLTFETPAPEVPTFEESLFEDASFEETTFDEAAFDDTPAMTSTPPAPTFEEARFEAPPSASAEDSFAAASLHIGGDSAPAGNAFDDWRPEAVAPVAEPTVAPIAPMADTLVVEAPAAQPAPPAQDPTPPQADAAWVARPGRPDSADAVPTTASADDFVFATPAPTPEPASAAPEAPATGLIDMDALLASSEPAAPAATPQPPAAAEPTATEPPAEPEVAPVPEGAEDLTVISTIDDDLQRLLYQEGVLTLEEIAQWGRGQARRISTRVKVSEETIVNQWVFEAQAALFSRYSKQATS